MKSDFFVTKNEDMTPEERFQAVSVLKDRLEEDFVTLGELLSEIKRMRTYRIKGAKNFKEFVQSEYGMSGSLANKLIGIYELFIKDLNIDTQTVKEIGRDKLLLIKPLIKDSSYEVQEAWIKKAEDISLSDLNDEIKEIRTKERDDAKTMKDVLVEQYLDNMKGFFNCSGKELNYKLALYFQEADLEKVNEIIREKQRKFEEQLGTSEV